MFPHDFPISAPRDVGADSRVERLDLDDELNGPLDLGGSDDDWSQTDPGELDAYLAELFSAEDDPDDTEIDDATEMAMLQEMGIDLDGGGSTTSPSGEARPMAGVELFDLDDGSDLEDDDLAA